LGRVVEELDLEVNYEEAEDRADHDYEVEDVPAVSEIAAFEGAYLDQAFYEEKSSEAVISHI